MGRPHAPEPALLFAGILYSDESCFLAAKKALTDILGPFVIETPPSNWDHSDYYKKELGSPIMRVFIFFRDLIEHEAIVDIKLRTNGIEDEMSVDGKRRVNIDPGYITLANVVLATTKGYSHRLYLGKGIYGEVSLLYREKEKTFVPNIFTYQDYQDKPSIEVFLKARKLLKNK